MYMLHGACHLCRSSPTTAYCSLHNYLRQNTSNVDMSVKSAIFYCSCTARCTLLLWICCLLHHTNFYCGARQVWGRIVCLRQMLLTIIIYMPLVYFLLTLLFLFLFACCTSPCNSKLDQRFTCVRLPVRIVLTGARVRFNFLMFSNALVAFQSPEIYVSVISNKSCRYMGKPKCAA